MDSQRNHRGVGVHESPRLALRSGVELLRKSGIARGPLGTEVPKSSGIGGGDGQTGRRSPHLASLRIRI